MSDNETRERLLASLETERETVASLMARVEGEDVEDSDNAREELNEYPLCLDQRRRVEVVIGFGGPNIWIDVDMVKTDRGWEADSATWHGAWGSEHIERLLSEEEPLARWAMSEAEGLLECETN